MKPVESLGRAASAIIFICAVPSLSMAAGITGADIDEVVVTAQRIKLSGTPRAASEGTVLADQLENRPLLRVGELWKWCRD